MHARLNASEEPRAPAVLRDESGQGLTEYALLVGVVAALVLSCALLFRTDLSAAVEAVGAHVEEQAAALGGNGGRSEHAPGHGNAPPGQGGVPPGQVGS